MYNNQSILTKQNKGKMSSTRKKIMMSAVVVLVTGGIAGGIAGGVMRSNSNNGSGGGGGGGDTVPLIPINPRNDRPINPPKEAHTIFEPFIDVTMLQNRQDRDYSQLAEYRNWGAKNLVAAFMTQDVTDTSTPHSLWAGTIKENTSEYSYIKNTILDYEAIGSGVTISFGGANNNPSWSSPEATPENVASDFLSAINVYNTEKLDFDIEGQHVSNPEEAYLLGESCRALFNMLPSEKQAKLDLTLTLPVLPTGLTNDGQSTVTEFHKGYGANCRINIMAMDYGGAFDGTKMGQNAIDAGENTAKFGSELFGDTLSDFYKNYLEITPMIGLNDVPDEFFTFSDVKTLTDWVNENQVYGVSFWSLGRDFPGSFGGPDNSGDPDQYDGEYTETFAKNLDPSVNDPISGSIESSTYAISKNEIEISWNASNMENVLSYRLDINNVLVPFQDFRFSGANRAIFTTTQSVTNYDVKVVATNLNPNNKLESNELTISTASDKLLESIVTKFIPNSVYKFAGTLLAYNNLVYYTKYWYDSPTDGAPDQTEACAPLMVDGKNLTVDDLLNYGFSQEAVNNLK